MSRPGVNYKVVDPYTYTSIYLAFYNYKNDLQKIIDSPMYDEFRRYTDTIIDGSGYDVTSDDVNMGEYITVTKNINQWLQDTKTATPYVEIFRYLTMFAFGVVTCDVSIDKSSLIDMLKLRELSKMVKLGLPRLPSKGGTRDAIVPYKKKRGGWKAWAIACVTGVSAYLIGTSGIGSVQTSITNNLNTIIDAHSEIVGESMTRAAPGVSIERYEAWKEINTQPTVESHVTPMGSALVPADYKFPEDEVAMYKTIDPLLTESLDKTSLQEKVMDLVDDSKLSIGEVYSLVTTRQVPKRIVTGSSEIIDQISEDTQDVFNRVARRVRKEMASRAKKRALIRQGTKMRAALEDTEYGDSLLEKGKGIIHATWSYFSSGPVDTIAEATALSASLPDTLTIVQADGNAALTYYTTNLARLIPDTMVGIKRDISSDLLTLNIAMILALITVYISTIQIFGSDNRVVRYIVFPMLTMLLNDPRIIALLSGAQALAAYTGIQDRLLYGARDEDDDESLEIEGGPTIELLEGGRKKRKTRSNRKTKHNKRTRKHKKHISKRKNSKKSRKQRKRSNKTKRR